MSAPTHISASLPTLLERKRTLRGEEKTFPCRVLLSAADEVVVLFISDRTYVVGGLTLPPGTITFGHFWRDRPYNTYHWITPAGVTLGHYFSLADKMEISSETLSYLDLTVDVLGRPGAPPAILDADEVPPDLDPDTRARISMALAEVLRTLPSVTPSLEARANELWPRAFGSPRP